MDNFEVMIISNSTVQYKNDFADHFNIRQPIKNTTIIRSGQLLTTANLYGFFDVLYFVGFIILSGVLIKTLIYRKGVSKFKK